MKIIYKLLGYKIQKTNNYNNSLLCASKIFNDNPNILFRMIIEDKYIAYKICGPIE